MKRKGKLLLNRTGRDCEQVAIESPYVKGGVSIGRICKIDRGYEYYSFPMVKTPRGPVRTKAMAILKVVKSYRSWIG